MFKLSLVQYLSIYLVITFHYALYFTTLAEYPLCTHLAPLYCWMCLRSGVVPSKLVKIVRRVNCRWCVPPVDYLWNGARCVEG